MAPCGVRWIGFAATDMSRIGVVAALEREVAPLIRNWKTRTREHSGRSYKFFENGDVVVVCGGIGLESARRATQAIIQVFQPSHVVSVGFVGALDPKLRVGEVLQPRTVIDAKDGSRTDTGSGEGTLVSFGLVAGREQKEKLHKAYGAAAVDMEAAAVAQAAQLGGVEFGALKVVSDEADFDMPAMEVFVGADGRLHTVKFALHVAVRPRLWAATIALARNSARSSRALCGALDRYLILVAVTESSKGGTT
jgi:adenosylhomocysteine nucleosidase